MQKKVPYVAQLGNMDCSIACMTMLFRYYGLDVDIVDVGQVVHIGRDGVNLTQLKQATQQFGFKCTAYRYNKQKNILDSNLPAVVYSGSHLAVIGSKTVLGQYILLDPIKGKSIVNFEQIHDTFSDILITIRPEKRIKRKKCKPKLKVAINYKLVAGIISLMLLIQALTLSIPLVEQALIDSITQSQSLLNSAYILVGCIVIAGLYFFLSIARQKLMLRLDISFVKEIMTKMLKKLFDIDPSFFEWHAVGEIVNRFSNVQAMQNPRDVEQLIDSFSNVKVRHLVQDTQRYSMLMHASYHPDVMQDGLSRNLLLCSMFKSYKKVQRTIAVVKEEIRDLLNMDIPYFYTKASGTSLYSSRDEEIKGYFDKSSIDKAHLRLASFNNLDRDKQCRFIKMTLTHIDKQPPAETNTHKIKENKDGDYASKNDIIRAIKFIADQLLEEAVLSEDNKDANWLGVKLVGDYGHGSLSIRPLDVYLYEGVAGICIFFAAISRYYSNYELQRVLSAATKSLFDYTEDILQREGNHIDSSGVFGGESSLVYSYSLLYQLTRNPEYLKYAEKHFPIIERAVQYDQAFDVVYGNAGAILALINLYSLKRDKRYLNCAKTAAKVICDAQQKGGGWKAATVSAPLAGFSHGVAGIVYALNKLYKLYPDKHIKQCIVNGLQYEDELFCEADGNWKDIRKGSTNGKNLCAWCHGAGGILLSRISLLGNIDNETDEIVKEDIRNAVKTMQSHKYLQNPCVCHGIAGNAEILLTYGQQFQDQIASSTAKHFYSRLVGSVNSGTFECSRPYLYGFNIPGFMTGLAGIGYSLLRLLDPTLPSVLQINI